VPEAIPSATPAANGEYLLLKSRPGDWSSPKGGIEGGRGAPADGDQGGVGGGRIEDFRLIDGFRKEYDYVFEANGNTIHKTVHLFIARARSKRAPKFERTP